MNFPLVSVIIPVYNVEKFLTRCINSVINQSYKNLEIILVNDGSTDESGTICEEYKKYDKRIKVIHKENGGLSSARNAGLDMCRGEYISFVDSDDYIDLDFIKKMMVSLLLYNCELCIAPIFMENNGKVWNFFSCKTSKLTDFVFLTFPAWNKIYKKRLFDNIRYPLNKYAEDAFIYCDLVYGAKGICAVSDTAYYYNKATDNSITHSLSDKYCIDNIESHVVVMTYLIKNKINNKTINFIMRDTYDIFIFYKFLTKERKSPKSVRKAIDKNYRSVCKLSFSHLSLKNKFIALFPVIFYHLRKMKLQILNKR